MGCVKCEQYVCYVHKAYAFDQPIGNWDVSKVTNMQSMFQHNNGTSNFNQDISGWDVSNVTNMVNLFHTAIVFNQNLLSWNVQNGTDLTNMFQDASKMLNSTDIEIEIKNPQGVSGTDERTQSYLATPNYKMFHSTFANTTFKPADRDELQNAVNEWCGQHAFAKSNYGDINTWDTSLITDMSNLFDGKTTFNDDISGWDVSNVTTMKSMFSYAEAFNQPIGNWDVSNVTTMYCMFVDAQDFNQPIGNWDVTKVTDMQSVFYEAQALDQNIRAWDVSNVTTMYRMFYDATKMNSERGAPFTPSASYFVNHSPTFNDATVTVAEHSTYTYNITASDQDGDICTITAETKPDWMTFTDNGDSTALLTGVAPSSAVGTPQSVSLRANDGYGKITDNNFDVIVSNVPVTLSATVSSALKHSHLLTNGSPALVTANVSEDNASLEIETATLNYLKMVGWSWVNVSIDVKSHLELSNSVVKVKTGEHANLLALIQEHAGYNLKVNVTMKAIDAGDANIIVITPNVMVSVVEDPPIVTVSDPLTIDERAQTPVKSNDQDAQIVFSEACSATLNNTTNFELVTTDNITYTLKFKSGQHDTTNPGDYSLIVTGTSIANTMQVTSSFTITVLNVNEVPTGTVTISGTATEGETLTASNNLADVDGMGAITYQWSNEKTGSTITLEQADVGSTITVTASYTDNQGTVESVTSSATSVVVKANDPPTGTVTISGTATEGETLTASNNLADVDGMGAITYQWSNGKTGSTITLEQADIGSAIIVTASYTDGEGTQESVTSSATNVVVKANDPPTGTVTISGTATEGETLTASNNLADVDGMGAITYQWSNGKTGSTITLEQADIGSAITVTASYTDVQGTVESVTSSATSAIARRIFQPQSKSELSTAIDLWVNNNASALSTHGEINTWDTSLITDMRNLFYRSPPLNFNSDIGNWNTSSVTDMFGMFYNCDNFNQNISQKEVSAEDSSTGIAYTAWDTGLVTSMNQMFGAHDNFNNGEAAGLSNKPLNWNTSNVINMYRMFYYANAFNQDIGNWNTSKVETMRDMFRSNNTFNRDIGNWNTSKVETMQDMFRSNNAFNQDIGNWNTSNVANMYGVFYDANAFNKPIGNWNTSNVTDMSHMFRSTNAFNQDIGNWNTSKVTSMYCMFYYANKFNQDISRKAVSAENSSTGIAYTAWDTPDLTSLAYFLAYAKDFNNDSFGNWDLSNVTDITNALINTNLSAETYSNFLISLATSNVQSDLTLKFVPSIRLDTANQAHTTLTSDKNMTIYDGDSYTAEELIAFQQDEPYMIELNSDTSGTTHTLTDNNMPIHITDSGGVRDPYQTGENYNLHLTGNRPFTLVGTSTMYAGNDSFKIYDGSDDSANLLFTSSLNMIEPINVQSGGNNIYITFTSAAYVTQAGFHLTVNYVNTSPTGTVTISGTAKQGETLTASNNLADVDGMGAITYQWSNGKTGSTITLEQADVGSTITVTASYTDNQGTVESETSSATNVVVKANDPPTGTVTISGTAKQGETLTASNNLADVDGMGAITYQWSNGKTGSTITLEQADVGSTITVTASYTDNQGTVESETSSATNVVVKANDPPTGTVTISGTAKQGETLTASNNLADVDGMGAITYQWSNGKTGSTITLEQADVGSTITVTASYTDNQGTVESETSSATSVVVKANDPPTGTVTISGTAKQGEVLTALNNLADVDGMGAITYQWKRGGVAIGTDSNTYILVQSDIGSTITVTTSYTDGEGTQESVISRATDMVVGTTFKPANNGALKNAVDLWTSNKASALERYNDISGWDTSLITNMSKLFNGKTTFNDDISSWDVSNVKSMEWMFRDTEVFNRDISNWDVRAVSDMRQMFAGAQAFDQYIRKWQIDSIKAFYAWMFAFNGKESGIAMIHTYGNGNGESQLPQDATGIHDFMNVSLTINGIIQDNEKLTSKLSSNATNGDITYQWKRNGVAIAGATASTYTLVQLDVGATITVSATYNDKYSGVQTTLTSDETVQVVDINIAPIFNSDAPTTLDENGHYSYTVITSDHDGDSVTLSTPTKPSWLTLNGNILSGTPLEANKGNNSVVLELEDAVGNIVTQSFTINVAFAPIVMISGESLRGHILTADLIDVNGRSEFSYQWHSTINGTKTNINGETNSTYTLTSSDIGKTIGVTVTYTDVPGIPKSITSEETSTVDIFVLTDENIQSTIDFWISDNAEALTRYGNISGWDTSVITNMKNLFKNKKSFNDDISAWDVSSVTDMEKMFKNARLFNQPISNWNISNVTNISYMLQNAQAFNQPITTWNLSSVTNMDGLFANAYAYKRAHPGVENTPIKEFFPYAGAGSLEITGTLKETETLTADINILNSAAQVQTYQWKRNNVNIGTNSAQYTLTSADVGNLISLSVQLTDDSVITGKTLSKVLSGSAAYFVETKSIRNKPKPVKDVNNRRNVTKELFVQKTNDVALMNSQQKRDLVKSNVTALFKEYPGETDFVVPMATILESLPIPVKSTKTKRVKLFDASSAPLTIDLTIDLTNLTQEEAAEATEAALEEALYIDTSVNIPVTLTFTNDTVIITQTSETEFEVDHNGVITVQNVGERVLLPNSNKVVTLGSITGENNEAPTFNVAPDTVAEGSTYTYDVVVTDPDGDTCSITAVSKPAWMTLTDHGNNTATLTGTEPSAEVGTSYSVTLNADDSNGGSTDYTFAVTVTEVNVVPTGTVTISGTATEGQDLTASNNLADGDGMINATITYQWSNGKTGSTITLEQADVGSTITVTASYTDDQGNAESETSLATSEVANVNDSPTGTVTISGTATEGETLTASNNLADVDGMGAITYQWSNGKTGSTITLEQADVGSTITVTASYTDDQGNAESETSLATSEVANVNDSPTGTVTISGTATEGQDLTASNNLADGDGMINATITYQWSNGKTGSTITLEQADVGSTITVTASYTDDQGNAESETSLATSEVANVNDSPTGTVTISGTATEGETLTASNNLADVDGMINATITYQWSNGKTGSTITLEQADVGSTITVTASYTDDQGNAESETSLATSEVANVNDSPTGTVTISGTTTKGQVLTASNDLADGDGMINATITYQWSNGKTGSTITLEQADVGSTITVTASYTDDQGNAESVTSSATSEIADENNSPANENNSSSAGIDFYFEGLASTLTLDEEIEFLDVDFQSTLEDIPHVEITLTDPQRIQLNKMFVVELAEDTHIDQATSTLTDEVYESSVTGYQTDETKMPHMGTDLGLATQSLANNGHRVSPTTHGEASVKFMQRNMDTDTIADSFVSDLIHQAILFRFVENELSNEEDLVDEIEDFLEGTETYHLSGILNQKLIDSKTDETQPHSLAYASFHTLVKSITDSANAQQNKRLTNDPINGMFRHANKVGYVDENNQGDDNAYYMEFLAGDHFIFKLTLNPSATPVTPVYANGQVPSQQPRSLYIKLKIE